MTMDVGALLDEGRPRRLVLELYGRATQGWPFLTGLFMEMFKTVKPDPWERAAVAETVMDMVRWRRKVMAALQLGEEEDASAILEGTLRLRGMLQNDGRSRLTPEQLELLDAWPQRLAAVEDPVERLGLTCSLPNWIAQLLVDELGELRANSVGLAFNQPPPNTLRVNTITATRDLVLAELGAAGVAAHPTSRAPQGVSLDERTDVYRLEVLRESRAEMQDEASQLICELVAPPPKGFVLDVCAGAGGKTLGMAAILGNKGHVLALDVHRGRLEELRKRVKRASLHNVEARLMRAGAPLPPDVIGKADRVLVDAPCSGLGALRRNPEARWRLNKEDVVRLAEQQRDILRNAAAAVAPRGRLIYAVCSITRMEGPAVVEAFLASNPEFEPVTAREVLGGKLTQDITDAKGVAIQTLPDVLNMDGFYAAVMRRKA